MTPSATGRNLCAVLALLALLCLAHPASAGIPTEVVLNRSVLLNLNKMSERVSIAAPEIAELVVISPTQLQINGKKIGSTTLVVWEVGGKTSFFDVRVKGDASLLEAQIQEMAPNDSIKVDFANDTIVLSGKAANDQTVAKAVQLARAYAYAVEGGGESAATDGALDTSQASYQIVERDKGQAKQGPSEPALKVLNHIVIDAPQQVLLEVKVAQVDKSALKSVGISTLLKGTGAEGFSNLAGVAPFPNSSLQPGLGSQGLMAGQPGLGALNGAKDVGLDAFQLGVSFFKPGVAVLLKALESKNLAKVLAEPNLLVQSGQVGKFLAGSKIPFSYVSGVGALSATSIQFIDVGVKLNFKPEVLENGLISLKIDPAEVSGISGSLAVNGYPIIDTREVRTRVQLKDGESLVLAGLLQEETIRVMSKIPMLGDIPILGALFRSTQDDIKQKELVFFITPRLAKVAPPGAEYVLPTDEPLTPDEEKELKWIPLPK